MELTAKGQRLAQTVAEAYGSIEAELLRLDAGEIRGTLRLRSIPSFLAKWLIPRLPRFQQRYPDIELRLVAEDSKQALHDGDFDLAIDLNDGCYPGMLSTPLLDEQIFPVCSPALLRGRPPLHGPADLVHYTLLHDITAWRGSSEYDELERGTLIVPFGVSIPNHKRYVLLYPPGGLTQPGARAVHDWLVEEAQTFRALHPLM